MATLHNPKEGGNHILYIKGAVEKILEACTDAMASGGGRTAFSKEDLLIRVDAMAHEGLRVLALARKETDKKNLDVEDCLSGLTFLGLQGMIDPPRKEAIAAVRSCHQAGIAVKMITGDHAVTATEIARQLNIGNPKGQETVRPRTLTGKELEKLTDEELIAAAEDTSVFARVAPEQKLRLVEALQARHHIVAMTGDGVNDAPALKQANIGIAMGITGTDVSKEAADMVLTDDNFASITRAVEEGRRIFDNLVKFIPWTLPTNGIFVWQQQQGYSLAQARTVAVNLFIMIELTYLFNCRSLTKSMFRIGVLSNPWVLAGSAAMIGLQLLFTYAPAMNRVFQSEPISGRDRLIIIAVAVAVYVVIGAEKWLRSHAAKTS